MNKNSVYRDPCSQDFGSPCTITNCKYDYRGLIEISVHKRKNKYVVFVCSDEVFYARTFNCEEDSDYWFNTIALKWEDVTTSSLESCGFKRVEG